MTNRTPRDLESREKTARPKSTWRPSSLLPDPAKEPGYKFRWIRTSSLGHSDPMNVSRKMREGWEPVKAEDHPELDIISDIGAKPGTVEVGGLMLCKTSEEHVEARNSYYEELAQRQHDSVENNYMRESDPRMPMLRPERKSRTTFGSSSGG